MWALKAYLLRICLTRGALGALGPLLAAFLVVGLKFCVGRPSFGQLVVQTNPRRGLGIIGANEEAISRTVEVEENIVRCLRSPRWRSCPCVATSGGVLQMSKNSGETEATQFTRPNITCHQPMD